MDDVVYAEKEAQRYAQKFAKASYETLYEMAFRERPECFDAAGVFFVSGGGELYRGACQHLGLGAEPRENGACAEGRNN